MVERGDGNGVVDAARELGVVTREALYAEESGRIEAVAEVSGFMTLTEVAGPVARSCHGFSTANNISPSCMRASPHRYCRNNYASMTHNNTYLAFFQRAKASA